MSSEHDELEDWRASAKRAADETCGTDQKHCTCVGLLRQKLARAQQERDELQDECQQLQRIAENAALKMGEYTATVQALRGALKLVQKFRKHEDAEPMMETPEDEAKHIKWEQRLYELQDEMDKSVKAALAQGEPEGAAPG